jgi:hypothetical protein
MAGDAIFAGAVCGHILALIAAPIIARALLLSGISDNEGPVRLPPILIGLSPMMLAVPVFLFAVVLLSMLGLIFGVLFVLLQGWSALPLAGTPNLLYSCVVIFFVVQAAVLFTVLMRRAHWTTLALAMSAVVLYGWVLPNLALLNQ